MTLPNNPYKKVYLTSKFGHTKKSDNIVLRFDENNNEVEDGGMYAYSNDEETGRLEDQHHQLLLEGEDTNAVRAAGHEMGLEGMASEEENFTFNTEDYIYNEDEEGEQLVDEFFYEDYNENEDDRAQDSYDKYPTLLDGMFLFGRLLRLIKLLRF